MGIVCWERRHVYDRWPPSKRKSAAVFSENLLLVVEDIDPHIIGITESWATPDISDAELGMTGYVMFRKDRSGRRGGGVILYRIE